MLLPEYPGVYRVGHRAPCLEARYLAAVWACGEEAFLCGQAAAHLLGLLSGSAPPPEVTTPRERRIKGSIAHRSRRLDLGERMIRRAIPVTSVARTLVDIAGVVSEAELARACHEAGVRYRSTPSDVEAVLARYPNAPGARKLRAVLRGDAKVVLSRLEARFLELLRDEGLPLPQTNRRLDGRRVDCRWPEHRLTVELNGYRYHRSRRAWEKDNSRQREAYARGDEFRSYTWGDVFERHGRCCRSSVPS